MKATSLIFVALFSWALAEAKLYGCGLESIVGLGLLTIGVGHGLFDAVLAGIVFQISFRKATAIYALAVALVAFLAWWIPLVALATHATVSAFHFGQAEWRNCRAPSRGERIASFIWGAALVLLMVLGPWAESEWLLKFLQPERTKSFLIFCSRNRLVLLIIANLGGAGSTLFLAQRQRSDVLARLFDLLLLNALFLSLPLWLSFSLFLSLWHGWSSLSHDTFPLLGLTIRQPKPDRSFLPAVSFATLATLSIAAALLVIFHSNTRMPNPLVPISFALLTAVTLPHVFVMGHVGKVGFLGRIVRQN